MSETLDVAFRTLGCKVNRVETEDIAAELLGRGVRIVAEDDAAVVVVNTCTVTGEADAKARKAVRQALKAACSPLVVVTGCAATTSGEALAALGERVIVEPDKDAVPTRVAEALGIERMTAERAARTGDAFRTRVAVKVQDGCDAGCAYCIVPRARGGPRSVPMPQVLDRVRQAVADGTHEVVLTGINLGRYAHEGADLADLVSAVALSGIERMRLSSIEPLDLTGRLLGVLSRTPSVCAHLHVPLQSGSDEVLSAMGRGYTIAQFEATVAAARDALGDVTISTDVMVGFPGETEQAAAETRAACERIGFAWLHVFRYSMRPETRAATMPQVTEPIKAERAGALREMSAVLHSDFLARQIGREAEILVERIAEEFAEGITREHVRARIPSTPGVGVGDLVRVRLAEGVEEPVAAVAV